MPRRTIFGAAGNTIFDEKTYLCSEREHVRLRPESIAGSPNDVPHTLNPQSMFPQAIDTVCFSPTGTSRRIARTIAEAIARQGHPVATDPDTRTTDIRTFDLTHASAPAATLPATHAVLFVVPVYGGHPAPTALERMRDLRGEATPAVIVVVYGNRAFERAAAELADFVARRGFRPVAAAAFVGEHSYSSDEFPIAVGRPDQEDLAQATAFGRAAGDKLLTGAAAEIDIRRLKTPRTPLLPLLRFIGFVLRYRRQQRRRPIVRIPAGDEARCTHCGRCAALCPTQAIARGDETRTDPERCIRCCACVKGCPVAARSFETPFAAALARNFRTRKPPVTLL